MEMKIDSQKVRRLREARGWSQEHLAEVAGLSPRTVQRIESDGNASPESRMALATALSMEAAALGLPEPVATPAPVRIDPQPDGNPHGWRRHLLVFLFVCGGLVLFDFIRHDGITWSKWPLLGWSIGLLLHWLRGRKSPSQVAAS